MIATTIYYCARCDLGFCAAHLGSHAKMSCKETPTVAMAKECGLDWCAVCLGRLRP